MPTSDDYKKRAAECHELAKSGDPVHRAEYERMAHGWLALAAQAERVEARLKETDAEQ